MSALLWHFCLYFDVTKSGYVTSILDAKEDLQTIKVSISYVYSLVNRNWCYGYFASLVCFSGFYYVVFYFYGQFE